MAASEVTMFEAVGGEGFFVDLVDRFYQRVTSDLLLRPLYPDDLTEPKRHLVLFLQQYWGGPGYLQRGAWAPASAGAATCPSSSARPREMPGSSP